MSRIEIQHRSPESIEARFMIINSSPWNGEGDGAKNNSFGSSSASGLAEVGMVSTTATRVLAGGERENEGSLLSNPDLADTTARNENAYPTEAVAQNLNSASLTRRKLLQLGAGAFLGITTGRLFDRDSQTASAQEAESAYDYSTPSPTPESDDRLHNVQSTVITRDELLLTNPPHLPIESISLNPNFPETEAQNRLDVAMVNGLIRAHAVSERYVQGEDFSGMLGYLSAGEYPEEPNWNEYIQRIRADEPMKFRMMALSVDDPVDGANVTWKEADLRKGVKLHFVAEPALITAFGQPNGIQEIGWSYKVDDEGQIQIDLHMNYSIMEQYFTDMQLSYNTGATMAAQLALQGLSTTLGIVDHSKKTNLYQSYIIAPQYEYVMNAGKENFTRSFFREQTALLMGDPYLNAQGFAEYFPNSILHINLANTK